MTDQFHGSHPSLRASRAGEFHIDRHQDDSFLTPWTLGLYHLRFLAQLLEYHLGVAAPMFVGVVETHLGQ